MNFSNPREKASHAKCFMKRSSGRGSTLWFQNLKKRCLLYCDSYLISKLPTTTITATKFTTVTTTITIIEFVLPRQRNVSKLWDLLDLHIILLPWIHQNYEICILVFILLIICFVCILRTAITCLIDILISLSGVSSDLSKCTGYRNYLLVGRGRWGKRARRRKLNLEQSTSLKSESIWPF